jgi:hypothetical protein
MPTITDIERDEVNVNLTVLAKLPINTRLNTSGVYMNIESETYIPQFVRRWARGDNRDEMIQKINRVVIKAISIISQNPNDIELLTHLNNASTGIMNLKETYSTCVQTCARLDVINNKIKSRNVDIIVPITIDL